MSDEKKAGAVPAETKSKDAETKEEGHVNPAPEDANTTPGSTGEK